MVTRRKCVDGGRHRVGRYVVAGREMYVAMALFPECLWKGWSVPNSEAVGRWGCVFACGVEAN